MPTNCLMARKQQQNKHFKLQPNFHKSAGSNIYFASNDIASGTKADTES